MNFFDIVYLNHGNDRQQKAFDVLNHLQIMDKLYSYNPILVGTLPIEIDIDDSDLDVICEVNDLKEFQVFLRNEFSSQLFFRIEQKKRDNQSYVVSNFHFNGFDIEIFGQDLPSIMQNGYRHMLLEYRLLKLFGSQFQEKVIKLKEQGYKTEPAFSCLLDLKGNAYTKLLELETFTDEELKTKFSHIHL